MSKLKAIPTNVITGFLGVGKSTAILNLLKQKPADERWAVLVNEFGEVGIDGGLITGQETEESGIFVREVPGGCMCCAAGLPMQIALNRLLARARPHRLLIEPTGLGHPREVLAVLGTDYYRELLDLRATITLIDARKVHEDRYTSHPTFNQQLAIADVIVANKADRYQSADFPALLDFLERTANLGDKSVFQVSQGALRLDWLAAPAGHHAPLHPHDEHRDSERKTSSSILETPEIPETGYLCIENKGEGFFSRGWIFNPGWTFDARKLYALLLGVDAERVKGVFITDQGITAYNKADNVLTAVELDDCVDSRVECISSDAYSFETLEAELLECVLANSPYSSV
ncbi:CobW family GTP-binding protein [Parahaliea mediterranea]|uniref:GTP-binding protein n=1 Tax=Parahaliea mediterranea TaxID=651086 RepID=A0A939IJA4_9GAMM|nr:GTP-binding protein [Parahaliea mediterranea]MBN7796081.1 GTP-binding protein [Parahaliea mediterranea]